MKHKLFTLLLALIASVGSLFAQSGTCGDNLTWNLTNGVLTISGTGAMTDFNSTSDNPWYGHRNAIKSVIIGDGITSIGKGAFYNCSVLTSVTIGNSVKSIEQGAFQNCSGLPSIVIPNSVTSIEYGAFKGCTVLKSVTMGNSIKSLGDYAFENCSSLNSVTIPNSVTSIGYGAFGNCSGLASVTIGNSLTSIGNFAFYNCSGLTSVTNYATTPQTIDEYVFGSVNISSCTLQVPAGSVTAYKTATVWKDFGAIQAISGDTPCTPISGTCGVNLSWKLSCDGVLTISGMGAMADFNSASDIPWYEYRYAIKSVVVSKGVTSIASNAFQKCTNLTSVTIPNSVTSIGQVAFYECTALTSVKIPGSVTSIGMGAFTYCSGLTSLTIPNSVRSIGQAAFGYCTGLKSVTIGSGITSIEHGLFGNCTALTSVTIPSNVTSIGQVAFYNCTGLTSVTIPSSVTSIGMGAFSGCSSLTSVTIPDGITSIEQETFGNCSSLTSVVIPNGVTSIGDWAFQNCAALTSVEIPNSVTSISDEVFSGCTALRSVTNYATTPQTIDEYVFDNVNISACTLYVPAGSLAAYKKATVWKNFGTIQAIGGDTPCTPISGTCGANLTWELSCDSVLTISGTGAMADFNSTSDNPWYAHRNAIKSVIIGNSVTSIGNYAFWGCGLTSVTINSDAIMKITLPGASFADIFGYQVKNYMIGNGVTSIGDWTFYNCRGLTSVTIPNSVTSIGEAAFLDCSSLTSVTIPSSVTSIGMGAFNGCSSLTSIVIPNGVTSIGDWTFQYCVALTSVEIPNSVTSIGDEVFSGCTALISVTNYATTPQTIDAYVFDGVNISSCTLHVPAESRANYQTADVWKDFGQILPINAEDIDVTTTTVTASATTADIVWPKVTGAVTYTLEIKKNGELICTLTFDAEGHLISMSFAAPSRHNAPHQTQAASFSFTITGLESGTTYNYTMTVKDNNGNVLKTESGTFTTIGAEGIEDAQSDQVQNTKILRNGQIFIQRGEKIYTITGQEIQSY
ncbi:MAG: leucine-rich repeat domain-containing protein [Paludibacteraceae bacterium]|nr:leucine-rich repeat domain-containing protein [Paludibacteraceae bacterium]